MLVCEQYVALFKAIMPNDTAKLNCCYFAMILDVNISKDDVYNFL